VKDLFCRARTGELEPGGRRQRTRVCSTLHSRGVGTLPEENVERVLRGVTWGRCCANCRKCRRDVLKIALGMDVASESSPQSARSWA